MSDGWCKECKGWYSLHGSHAHPLGPPPGFEEPEPVVDPALKAKIASLTKQISEAQRPPASAPEPPRYKLKRDPVHAASILIVGPNETLIEVATRQPRDAGYALDLAQEIADCLNTPKPVGGAPGAAGPGFEERLQEFTMATKEDTIFFVKGQLPTGTELPELTASRDRLRAAHDSAVAAAESRGRAAGVRAFVEGLTEAQLSAISLQSVAVTYTTTAEDVPRNFRVTMDNERLRSALRSLVPTEAP